MADVQLVPFVEYAAYGPVGAMATQYPFPYAAASQETEAVGMVTVAHVDPFVEYATVPLPIAKKPPFPYTTMFHGPDDGMVAVDHEAPLFDEYATVDELFDIATHNPLPAATDSVAPETDPPAVQETPSDE